MPESASSISLVVWMSCREGVQLPLGWLCCEVNGIGVVQKAQPGDLTDIDGHAVHGALVDNAHVF